MKREQVIEKLRELGQKVLEKIEKGENPYIEIPIRSLSNIIWDEKRGLITLGENKAKRYFFHVGHARKFMQTMLVASFCEKLLEENIHTSIRDMYYNLKRTLPGSKENTFEEQAESDPIIIDLETSLGVLREQLHLIADRKGVVAGNVVIRDRGDEIDWSKLGSGGWSIPSAVEDIEFVSVDADFILVVEKNAAFERLHEDKFWKKHNCILIGTGGQAARGTRRLINRLRTEFNLPVYVMTDADSIPPWEIVIVRDKETKEVKVSPIGKLLEDYVDANLEKEFLYLPWETLAMDEETGKIEWKPIEYVYRHRIDGELLRIHTYGRGVVEVTPAHSLFAFRNGKIESVKASELKEGDYLVVSRELPPLAEAKEKEIVVAEILKENLPKENHNRIYLYMEDGRKVLLRDATQQEIQNAIYVRHANGKQKIKNKIRIDERFAWLLGLWVAEGTIRERYVEWHLGRHEEKLIEKLVSILSNDLNLETTIRLEGKNKTGIRISAGSSIFATLFKSLGLKNGSHQKQIPTIIFNSPTEVQQAFLKGLIDGDGHIDEYFNLVYFTSSSILAKQVTMLLLSFGVVPTIVESGKGIYVRVPYMRMNQKFIQKFLGIRKPVRVMYMNDSIYGVPNDGIIKKISINWMNSKGFSYSVKSKIINQQRFVDAATKYGIPEKYKDEINVDMLNSMVTFVRIKKIEKRKYHGDVFDFAVPKLNSFIGGSGIVFHNSYGWYIYSVIKAGSMNLAHTSELLGTPDARFIGLSASDIKEYGLENYTIKATERDIKRAKELLGYPWFKHKEWQKEIKLMIKMGKKAELEALSARGLRFITNTYLPEKISEEKFLP